MNPTSSLEQETPSEEVIQLDKAFFPFAESKYMTFHYMATKGNFGLTNSPVVRRILQLSPEHQVPIMIYLEPGSFTSPLDKGSFQPFNPQEGYLVTADDYNKASRVKKSKIAASTPAELMEPGGFLRIKMDGADLVRLGLAYDNPERYSLPKFLLTEEGKNILHSLTCEVNCNNFKFAEDYPGFEHPEKFKSLTDNADIWFGTFYPVDFGPPVRDGNYRKGQDIFLPSDPEKLQTINMTFSTKKATKDEESRDHF